MTTLWVGVGGALGSIARYHLDGWVHGRLGASYSSFNYETLRYFQDGAWGMGVLNVVATVFGCLVAGLLGWGAGRFLLGA